MQDPAPFKVYRRPEGAPDKPQRWCRLRQGVADLHRRADLCQNINGRYYDAFAKVDTDTTLDELIPPSSGRLCSRRNDIGPAAVWRARRAVTGSHCRGEFLIQGLRNRDLQRLLYPRPTVWPPRTAPTLSGCQSKNPSAARARATSEGFHHTPLSRHFPRERNPGCDPRRAQGHAQTLEYTGRLVKSSRRAMKLHVSSADERRSNTKLRSCFYLRSSALLTCRIVAPLRRNFRKEPFLLSVLRSTPRPRTSKHRQRTNQSAQRGLPPCIRQYAASPCSFPPRFLRVLRDSALKRKGYQSPGCGHGRARFHPC